MKGQASRGVWQPARASRVSPGGGQDGGRRESGGGISEGIVGRTRYMRSCGGGGGGGGGGGSGVDARGATFQLAACHATAAAAAGDALSDSESEDDEDNNPTPTPADARTAFDDSAAVQSGERGEPSNVCDEALGSTKMDEGRGRNCNRSGEKVFSRDDAAAALEGARRSKRIKDAERLADRMHAIGAEVRVLGALAEVFAAIAQQVYKDRRGFSFGNRLCAATYAICRGVVESMCPKGGA